MDQSDLYMTRLKSMKQKEMFVTADEAEAMAKDIGAAGYFETSSLTGQGVDRVFDSAIRDGLHIVRLDSHAKKHGNHSNENCNMM